MIAQIQNATSEFTGNWVAVIIALLGGAYLILQIYKTLKGDPVPQPDAMKEYITRGEFNAEMISIRTRMETMERDVKGDLKEATSAILKRMDDDKDYDRDSYHRINDTLQTLTVKVETIAVKQEMGAGPRPATHRNPEEKPK